MKNKMLASPENKIKGASKIKSTVILGYLLVMIVMAAALVSLYLNLVEYSDKKIDSEDMSELLVVGNTLSMLYEIESEQNLINADNAGQYFTKFDSIVPKIKANLDDLKQRTTDSLRVEKLDSIQLLVERKRENLQEIAALLDSIRNAPQIVVDKGSDYIPQKLNREIADYLESKKLNSTAANRSDTSVVAGNRRGFMDRVRDVFVARADSTVVIEKNSIVSGDDLKLIVDTVINKVRYSERLDLRKQRYFQQVFLLRQERMNQNNRMLTSRIDDLLKGIEQEELKKSVQLLQEKERTLANSQKTIFIAFCVALLIVLVFAVLFLIDINRSQRYRKQLEASNKRIGDLLASREKLMLTISHDIKAPMSSILGFIELMDADGKDKNGSYLSNMKNSGEHILALASALLDYHKLEEGSWQLKESDFNLCDLIAQTTAGFEPLASRKQLEYAVENDIPADLAVHGDLYMMRQIMNNLISNAVKYTSTGGITVRARLDADAVCKHLVFSVTDTGEGIDEDDQKIIFQEFRQLDNPLGEEGSGLGLAITKGFIEALKGSIHLISRKGEGSEFIVEIPLQDVEGDVPLHESRPTDSLPQDMEGLSVLLVDDDPIQLAMTSEMLGRKNIKCRTEMNPDKIMPLIQSSAFDLLLMDIQMPGTDGLTLVKEIRGSAEPRVKEIPVIALSARADLTKEAMRAAGFTDFLVKPFTAECLFHTIGRHVEGEKPVGDVFEAQEKELGHEKGIAALIEYVRDDKESSTAILDSFIGEMGQSRIQLEEAMRKKEGKVVQGIAHKVMPLFRLIGFKPLVALLEKLEKGNPVSDEENVFVLDKIQHYVEEARRVRNEIDGE